MHFPKTIISVSDMKSPFYSFAKMRGAWTKCKLLREVCQITRLTVATPRETWQCTALVLIQDCWVQLKMSSELLWSSLGMCMMVQAKTCIRRTGRLSRSINDVKIFLTSHVPRRRILLRTARATVGNRIDKTTSVGAI